VIVTLVEFDTRSVLIVNVALLEPAATVTVDGTDATDELLLERFTVVFADAVAVKVTVPCESSPPETLVGLNVSEDKVTLPPPLTQTLFVHVWPLPQVPQLNVPPQPSEMLPQFLPCAAQVVGVHRARAASGAVRRITRQANRAASSRGMSDRGKRRRGVMGGSVRKRRLLLPISYGQIPPRRSAKRKLYVLSRISLGPSVRHLDGGVQKP